MSMYRFSKSGRLFVQGTRENDDRDNVAGSSPTGNPATDLQAIYTKRRLSTEVLGIFFRIFGFRFFFFFFFIRERIRLFEKKMVVGKKLATSKISTKKSVDNKRKIIR